MVQTATRASSSAVAEPGTDATANGWDEGSPAQEQRTTPRSTLLIRAAKLIAGDGEFLVVVRDVSRDGLKVRTFHPLPPDQDYAIELSGGERHQIERIWEDGELNGFRFHDPVALERLLAEGPAGKRKRPVRLRLKVAVTMFARGRRSEGLFVDLSQHGACIATHEHLAIDERIEIESASLPDLAARVRWRRRPHYGLSFEQSFRLDDLARLTARQMPARPPGEEQSAPDGQRATG